MQDKKNLYNFWEKILHKYRFVVMTDDSFEEKFSVRLSGLNVFAFGGFLVFFSFFIAIILITNTALTEYVPGKANSEVQQELITLTVKSDSLLRVLENQDVYLENIRNIITGGELEAPKKTENKIRPASSPKVTTLVILLFSTKLFPSPGAVMVSNALYISCFLKLSNYFCLILIAKIRYTV